jgi:hypothetical protein
MAVFLSVEHQASCMNNISDKVTLKIKKILTLKMDAGVRMVSGQLLKRSPGILLPFGVLCTRRTYSIGGLAAGQTYFAKGSASHIRQIVCTGPW